MIWKIKEKKFSIILDKTDIFSQTSILSFEKWKKMTFFDVFAYNMKSCILPKFCVSVDWYHFIHFFFKFFSFLAKCSQTVISKSKEKKSTYFLDKTDFFSQTSILSFEKWKKKWFFSTFFENMKSRGLRKFCVKADWSYFFSILFDVFLIFNRTSSKCV